MTLSRKIQIANAVCICAFVASVATTFVYSSLAGPLFALGIFSGLRAAKWKKGMDPQAAPRPKGESILSRSIAARVLVGVAWLFYAILTAAIFWIGGSRIYQWNQFNHEGVGVSGHVISKEESPATVQHYRLTYGYRDNGDNDYRVRVAVDPGTWLSLNGGDVVPVKYLSRRHEESCLDIPIERREEGTGASFILVIGLAFLGFGVWGVARYLKTLRRGSSTTP